MHEGSTFPDEAAKRDSHITRQLIDMDDALDHLERYTSELASNLLAVLRNEEELTEKKNTVEMVDEQIVPLANRYRDHVRRVRNINSILSDIILRLEL